MVPCRGPAAACRRVLLHWGAAGLQARLAERGEAAWWHAGREARLLGDAAGGERQGGRALV